MLVFLLYCAGAPSASTTLYSCQVFPYACLIFSKIRFMAQEGWPHRSVHAVARRRRLTSMYSPVYTFGSIPYKYGLLLEDPLGEYVARCTCKHLVPLSIKQMCYAILPTMAQVPDEKIQTGEQAQNFRSIYVPVTQSDDMHSTGSDS